MWHFNIEAQLAPSQGPFWQNTIPKSFSGYMEIVIVSISYSCSHRILTHP